MAWTALTVKWSKSARRDMRGFTAKDCGQIIGAVERFAATGRGDVKKLRQTDAYRIRMRGRRILITFLWSERVVLVVEVVKRGDAY